MFGTEMCWLGDGITHDSDVERLVGFDTFVGTIIAPMCGAARPSNPHVRQEALISRGVLVLQEVTQDM